MSNPLPEREPERCASQPDAVPEILSWPSRRADLGAGLGVERALPLRRHRLVGPWCFFDHFGPLDFGARKAMDVAPHPHIGLQTVSWLFGGEVLHKDSLGSEGTARPGELNLMTAGCGIAHSEETPQPNSGVLHGLQLWVALPDAERERGPAFDHYRDLPVLEQGGGRAQVFMGTLGAARSPGRAFSPLVGADLQVGPQGLLRLPIEAAWEYALVVIEGEVALESHRLAPGALHYLGTRRAGIELASKDGGHAILIGGAPFGEDVVMWWNFVARSAAEIRAAREDWEAHRRFGDVEAYHGARLPAPLLVARPVGSSR